MEFDKPLSDADVLENRKIYKVNVAFFCATILSTIIAYVLIFTNKIALFNQNVFGIDLIIFVSDINNRYIETG